MTTVIILIIGLMLGGFGGSLIGFVLGADHERKKDNAPTPDIFEEDGTWKRMT